MRKKSGRPVKGKVIRRRGAKFEPVVYGLNGIMELFHVSKTTAHRYKEGIIRDAVTQNGNKIMVDTKEALRLYGIKNVDNLVFEDNGYKDSVSEFMK